MAKQEQWHTLSYASKRLGITPDTLRRRCKEEGWGRRVGGTFIISKYETDCRANGQPLDVSRMNKMNREKLYTPLQAAKVLGLHERHTRGLFEEGRLGAKHGTLWLVTASELMQFKQAHEKATATHATAKLTKAQVAAIRRNKRDSIAELGKRYGVAPSTIHRIQTNKTWRGSQKPRKEQSAG